MAVFDGSFKLQRFRLMYFDKNKLSLGYCDYADGLKHGNELRCNETKGTGGQCTPTMLRTYKKGLLHGFSVLFENGLPQVKYYYRQGQLKRTKELNR